MMSARFPGGKFTDGSSLSRRGVLVSASAVAGGLIVGFAPKESVAQQSAAGSAVPLNPLDVYIRIGRDSTVTVLSAHMDKGQGIYTGLATLVAEELDADWNQMRVEGASGNTTAYGNLPWGGFVQGTGQSTSMVSSWDRYRRAGATARAMLVQAAAAEWKVAPESIRIENGVLKSGTKSDRFGAFVLKAAALAVPQTVALKPSSAWRYIGKPTTHRVDTTAKITGQPVFTIDVDLPGMLTAVVIRPPKFGAFVKSFDADAARKVPGVTDVVSIGYAVAVVATSTWPALKARGLVKVAWDDSKAETRSSPQLFAAYREIAAKKPEVVALARGDVDGAFATATRVIEATYEFPYLAHAAMEPMNCVVAMKDGAVETWSAHQSSDGDVQAVMAITGAKPDSIKMNVLLGGGSFGRRTNYQSDFVVDALLVAKAVGWKAPIKLQWTREDDMTGGYYRPMVVHKVRAGLDAKGAIIAWDQHIVGQSINIGSPFEKQMVKDGIDPMSVEGAAELPYAVPNVRVGASYPKSPVSVLWWRAVGHTHTAYVTETMIDEIAVATKQSPIELRRVLLKASPRHRAVLDLAIARANWSRPAPRGIFRGIAVHESFNTYTAYAVELSKRSDDTLSLDRVVGAVDCGIAVNPDQVRAQMEGGIGFALSAITTGEITLDNGIVQQTNFDGYEVLRIEKMPRIEIHIVPSNASPSGIGEPPVPALGPALANAIARATGRRVRVLPMRKSVTI